MRRHYQTLVALFQATLSFAVLAATGLPPWSVKAAGDSTTTKSIVIGGSVSNSAIYNTVNKQDPALLAAMAKTFADQMATTTEAQSQAEAKAAELATKLGFTSAAVVEFFKILGEQNVPEEKIPARLIEVATHFTQTRDAVAVLEPDDPHASELARAANRYAKYLRDAPNDADLMRRIQMRGRLVQQQHVGLLGQRHREDHALALAARERIEPAVD